MSFLDHIHNIFTGTGTAGDPAGYADVTAHDLMTLNSHDTHAGGALSAHAAHGEISLLPPYSARKFGQSAAPAAAWTAPRVWTTGEVPTAAQLNEELRDNLSHLISRALESAAAIFWGTAGDAPTGWHHADGTDGYADLRNRFIIGESATYSGAGGAATATLPAHADHTPTQPNDHAAHTITTPGGHGGTPYFTGPPNNSGYTRLTTLTHGAPFDSQHPYPHRHSGFAVNAHSAHAAINTVPTFKALAYIVLETLVAMPTPKTWTTGEVVTAGDMNSFLRDIAIGLKAREVPIGAILGYVGGAVPGNYAVCDGGGTTPDMRDMFVPGAGLTYAVGDTGGANAATPAAHSAHTVTQPGSGGDHGLSAADHSSIQPKAGSVQHQETVYHFVQGGGVDHIHSGMTVDGHSAHAEIDTTPPFVAVTFIRRES